MLLPHCLLITAVLQPGTLQSSISVEALLWRCHLDVQSQQLLPCAMVQHCGLLPVNWVDRFSHACSTTADFSIIIGIFCCQSFSEEESCRSDYDDCCKNPFLRCEYICCKNWLCCKKVPHIESCLLGCFCCRCKDCSCCEKSLPQTEGGNKNEQKVWLLSLLLHLLFRLELTFRTLS